MNGFISLQISSGFFNKFISSSKYSTKRIKESFKSFKAYSALFFVFSWEYMIFGLILFI